MRAFFDRPNRDAVIQAAARCAAQEALILFADELAPPAAAPVMVVQPSAGEHAPSASLAAGSGDPAPRACGVPAGNSPRGVAVQSAPPPALTPKRKRDTDVEPPAPPSPEDDVAWNLVASMSQSSSPSHSLLSPLGRVRLSESPPSTGNTGSSSSHELSGAVPVLPLSAAEENGVAATQPDSAEESSSDGDDMVPLRPPRRGVSAVAGVEPSATPPQPADTPNGRGRSSSSESSGSTTIDYSDSDA